ncbi:copper homeostasis protein CutC [Sporolactobacillus sp. STSJ-5]|uniref:copper homeostasis protein CutC n=1 Tax=Sporolactobacillus sp. STSJ-5 TaxID=2965076 RepID=UPI00210813A1|nr:copper homeostasis protein CutC [Sporolactobacillus sp. STSJ-5]
MLIKEFCAENFTQIPAAIDHGADRIELCDNLAVGGTTVSYGVMAHSVQYCHSRNVPVMVMIRPRGGNFVYKDFEIQMMRADIKQARLLKADGIVVGCLTEQNQLNTAATAKLIEAATDLEITFHMAFDQLSPENQLSAIDWLAEHHVKRILTHGGSMNEPIERHFGYLQRLIQYAAGQLILLPGGGISSQNAASVSKNLNVQEVHGTRIVPIAD